jgi:hypothetical protein
VIGHPAQHPFLADRHVSEKRAQLLEGTAVLVHQFVPALHMGVGSLHQHVATLHVSGDPPRIVGLGHGEKSDGGRVTGQHRRVTTEHPR